MNRRTFLQAAAAAPLAAQAARRHTEVAIQADRFLINGRPTYPGRTYRGLKIEGLLMNNRTVQAIFDDANPATRAKWAYPDTGKWDPERNTREFLAALPEWRRHGLLAFTVNLQGGSPEGYSKDQPWDNTAIRSDGSLKADYMARLASVLDRADELGMVVILGIFYFGQDQRIRDEPAVKGAVANTVHWLLGAGYRNVLLEIDNETNVAAYDHEILKPRRIHELIDFAKSIQSNGRRLLTGTSYGGGTPAASNVVRSSDFLLLHGNGPDDPSRIRKMIEASRAAEGYRPMPVLINEDDHFRFGDADSHMMTALGQYVSWGYFDPGKSDYADGYQCPPVNWGMSSGRKREFFAKLQEVTGAR
jgi:hypothetical protein